MSTMFVESMFLKFDFSTPEGVQNLLNLILFFSTVCVFAGGIYRFTGNALYGSKDNEGKSINWDPQINSFVWNAASSKEKMFIISFAALFASFGGLLGVVVYWLFAKFFGHPDIYSYLPNYIG
jgi:hypothetical protein